MAGERWEKSITSFIARHLVKTGHTVKKTDVKVSTRLRKITAKSVLATAEAIAIYSQKPKLCQHKDFGQELDIFA